MRCYVSAQINPKPVANTKYEESVVHVIYRMSLHNVSGAYVGPSCCKNQQFKNNMPVMWFASEW